MAKTNSTELSPEERLQQALVPEEEWPYELPEGWKWVRIGDINCYQGTSVTPAANKEKLFELYSVPSFDGNYPEIIKGKDIGSSKQTVEVGDVLLCKINPRINRVWYVSGYTENELIASSEWIVIRNHGIEPRYLMYCLRSQYFRQLLLSNVSGVGGSLMRAQPKFVKNYPIPIAPYYVQVQIADFIDKEFARLDKAQEQIQSVIDSEEERKQSILHKAFTGELTEKWRYENNISFSSWHKERLKDICEINPKRKNTNSLSDNLKVSFFPMASLDEKTGTIVDPQTRFLGEVKTGFTNFREGDVVFAKITPCMENGKSAVIGHLLNDIGYGTTEFYVFRCSEKINNKFLFHLIRSKSFRNAAKQKMTGAVGQQRVPKKYLESYEMYLPSLEEQEIIVESLDHFIHVEDGITETAKQALLEIDELQKSILSRTFRGELSQQ